MTVVVGVVRHDGSCIVVIIDLFCILGAVMVVVCDVNFVAHAPDGYGGPLSCLGRLVEMSRVGGGYPDPFPPFPVPLPLTPILPIPYPPAPVRPSSDCSPVVCSKSILMHPINKPFNNPKRNKTPQIDTGQHTRVRRIPLPYTLALFQCGEELDDPDTVDGFTGRVKGPDIAACHRHQWHVGLVLVVDGDMVEFIRCADGREGGIDVSCAFALHVFIRGDGACEFRGGGVDGRKGKDVKQKQTAVVEEMFDALFGKPQIRIGEDGYVFHGADPIDMRDDTLHSQIPVLVHERFGPNGEDGDVPCFHGWWGCVGGEEFEVECIEAIDRDHAFAVIV